MFHDIHGKGTFYIADFYCHDVRLVVEPDGGVHRKQRERDDLCNSVLNALGITVLRFKNEDVEDRMDGVLTTLRCTIRSISSLLDHTPSPLRRRGRG